MRKSDFHYDLPEELIAQVPLPERTASRLLCLDGNTGRIEDCFFRELGSLLRPDDLLVFNDTRVLPARLFGQKETGGRVELLVERLLGGSRLLAHVRASKVPKPGVAVHLEDGTPCRVIEREGELFLLEFPPDVCVEDLLFRIGHIPLPPYIARADIPADRQRYQTVYAAKSGAVAAPTAGLHFDEAMLERLQAAGVSMAWVTLHVGSGTFQPIRVEELEQHRMHSEHCELDEKVVDAVARARRNGGRVIAVGTTTLRTLETAALSGELQPFRGETRLFIKPGFHFRCTDALITNFHLPQSTLLALVCAFAGRDETLHAYRHAVANRYRFFSYGDAMFVTRKVG
ncbi:MAG TPA: tRNA preQ1(34) S-adenosylmethionine ribosyltransferase-isomerase QueA [Methylococcus sp.]|nr:tRNA preQ1(34) S-adenosylmethionine ribosyltransferase-isomerase QueA [Methylococcus sp.]